MSQIVDADDGTFESEVLKIQGPVLVDFSAAWCGPCKKLEPVVHEIAGEYDGRLKVVKVDVDSAQGTAVQFGVMSVPTLLLFRDGEVKYQHVGLLSKQALTDQVEKLL